jgi:hypothetical protein
MHPSTVVDGDGRDELLGQMKSEMARRIVWLNWLPLAIPVAGALFSILFMCLLLLIGAPVQDSLYNYVDTSWRVLLVIALMLVVIVATHYCYASTLRTYLQHYQAVFPSCRQRVIEVTISELRAQLGPTGHANPPRKALPAIILGAIAGQFHQSRRLMHVSLVPKQLLVGFSTPIAMVTLALISIPIALTLRLSSIHATSAITAFELGPSMVSTTSLAGAATMACLFALPTIAAVAFSASRVALYRTVLDDEQIFAEIARILFNE